MWTYRLRYVRCGKPNCGTCAASPGHGPYWYGYEHRGNKVYSRYFGRRPTSTFDMPAPTPPSIDQRWTFKGRMDHKTALRIMAFPYRPSTDALRTRFRQLINEHHPDHGGSSEIAAAIIMAYKYLR